MGTLVAIRPRRRLYICGLRLHHGLTGAVLVAVGALLVAHDRRDFPWPLLDDWP